MAVTPPRIHRPRRLTQISVQRSNDAVPAFLPARQWNTRIIMPITAPMIAPPGINYSLQEQDTGITWLDGKRIYQKTIQIASLPGAMGTVTTPHNITGFDRPINAWIVCDTVSATTSWFVLPYADPTSAVNFWVNRTSVMVFAITDRTAYNWVYATLQYTCTDR